MPLGRSWAPLGRSLGVPGTLLDVSWAPLGSLGHLLNDFLALGRVRGMVLEGFWKGFGLQNCRLLGRFRVGLWEGSNNFWEGIWKGLGISISLLGAAWSSLGCHVPLGPPRCHALRTQYAGVPPKRG